MRTLWVATGIVRNRAAGWGGSLGGFLGVGDPVFALNLGKVPDLPSLPAVATLAIAVSGDPDSTASDLLRVIMSDPPLAAKTPVTKACRFSSAKRSRLAQMTTSRTGPSTWLRTRSAIFAIPITMAVSMPWPLTSPTETPKRSSSIE